MLVDQIGVGKGGVAAEARHVERAHDDGAGRLRQERAVGVEMLERGHDILGLVGLAPHLLHVVMAAIGRRLRQLHDLAEMAREGLVLLGRQRLVAEDQDEELLERRHDLGAHVVVERLAQVDARDLGAAGAADRLDADPFEPRHGLTGDEICAVAGILRVCRTNQVTCSH